MSQCQSQASYVLIVELSQHQILPTGVEASVQVLGCFTEQDLPILSLGIDFKTAKISEVMNILVIGLKQSEIHHISSALSILRQYNLPSLSVVYEGGKLIVNTTDESIYQVIEQEVGENAQTEERLCLLELAVDHANDAILIAEADALDEPLGSRIVYVNKALILMIGRLVYEVVGETWGILHGEKTFHSQLERIRAPLQSGLSSSTSN
ncbi:MAG: PAS domain-containing protein [Rhizonema sp. NSF051]|nr:PAS domain-containing protein [Rhizonema sp. NSF051]